jgi:hypothetical protein
LRTPRRGWPAMPRWRCWRCCCGSPDARSPRSSSVSSPRPPGNEIGWRGCAGSGSMRSPPARASSICCAWSTTTPAGWSGPGRTAPPPPCARSPGLLGETRSTQLTHVSSDGAEWIHQVVAQRAPQAVLCLDAFHVVASRQHSTRRRAPGSLEPATPPRRQRPRPAI